MYSISFRVTAFGDDLNVVNISGIIVVFLGVFLYKVTLHLSTMEKENSVTTSASDIEDSGHFSRISSGDMNFAHEEEVSPRRGKRQKNSDPDLALLYKIDDDDDDDDEDILMNIDDGTSPLRERNPLEVDEEDTANPGII